MARELTNMYNDVHNELYFTFLQPILHEFERLNMLYQKDNADHSSLIFTLENFFLTIVRRVVHKDYVDFSINWNFTSILLPLSEVDFGHTFEMFLKQRIAEKSLREQEATYIKFRCQKFLIKACQELQIRVPSNIGLLKKIKNLSPSFCLNHITASFSDLPLILADNSKLSAMENQYRMLLTIDWQEVFGDTGIPIDGSKFWTKAMNVKDAGGE